LTILECESYSRIALDFDSPPPIASLGVASCVLIDSFSYTLSPGLRVGFVQAEGVLRDKMLAMKRASSISGCQFVEMALARYIRSGRFEAHLSRNLPRYRARRDAMVSGLRTHMPQGTSWTHPAGGFSTWVTLPPGNYASLYQAALDSGVAFSPGSLLCAKGGAHHMRLSYGILSPEGIQQAIGTLGRLVKQRMASG
jgi:DNA-binding transcriptional MocR family regulator